MSFSVTVLALLSKSCSGGIEWLFDLFLTTFCQYDSLNLYSGQVSFLDYLLSCSSSRSMEANMVTHAKHEQTKVNLVCLAYAEPEEQLLLYSGKAIAAAWSEDHRFLYSHLRLAYCIFKMLRDFFVVVRKPKQIFYSLIWQRGQNGLRDIYMRNKNRSRYATIMIGDQSSVIGFVRVTDADSSLVM